MPTVIENLSDYPVLKAYLDSTPPTPALIDGHIKPLYSVKINHGHYSETAELKVMQVLALLGKSDHIKILPLVDAEKKDQALDHLSLWCAAWNGHLETIQHLEDYLTGAEKKAAIQANDYWVLGAAFSGGHLTTIQYLETYLTDAEKKAAVLDDDYFAIRDAAWNGHLEVIQYLETRLTDAEIKEAIQAEDYGAITGAASYGQLATIQYLETHLTDAEIKAMVKADNYNLIIMAAQNGCLEVIQHFETHLTDAEKKAMVKAYDYLVIRNTASHGHLDVIKYLETLLTDAEKKAAVQADEYNAIWSAAMNGHLDTTQHLEIHLTDAEKKAAVQANDYLAIRETASHGYIAVIQYLETHLSDAEKKEAVKACDYYTIQMAAYNGYLEVIQYLETHLTDAEEKAAVQVRNYNAIRTVAENGHFNILHYYAKYANVLNYIEKHHQEYSESFTAQYINIALEALSARREAFGITNPHGVFDIEDDEVARIFIMLRHLIRRNQAADVPKIQSLLTIPKLRNALHLSYADREAHGTAPAVMGLVDETATENELLRLAQSEGNTGAAAALLAIPTVRERAEAQDFYRGAVAAHHIDLSALALDRESSMRAVTPAQKQMKEAVVRKYKPMLDAAGGVDAVFETFKATLRARYEASPATMTLNGTVHALPFDYHDLQTFKAEKSLTNPQYQLALQAYHKHMDHTAFRYLLKPNPWMSSSASYTYINDARTERWSTFEEYIPLIAYFFMAASDEMTPCLDGSLVSERLSLFIKQVALIGRAHNWDQQNATGAEYDDITEGDKPSCYSGVLKRLYQSVLNHPLMTVLTDAILTQEIRAFVRKQFSDKMAHLNSNAIKVLESNIESALIYMTASGDTFESITNFNIDSAMIEAFKDTMIEKWGVDMTATIQAKITSEFMQSGISTHLEKFYMQVDVKGLIERRKETITSEERDRVTLRALTQMASSPQTQSSSMMANLARNTLRNTLTEQRNVSEEQRENFDNTFGLVPYQKGG